MVLAERREACGIRQALYCTSLSLVALGIPNHTRRGPGTGSMDRRHAPSATHFIYLTSCFSVADIVARVTQNVPIQIPLRNLLQSWVHSLTLLEILTSYMLSFCHHKLLSFSSTSTQSYFAPFGNSTAFSLPSDNSPGLVPSSVACT
jgi:hypothetical protein